MDDLGLRALDELPALGAAEITEALQSLVLEGQSLGAEAKSGDLLDMASQEQALDEAQSVSQEHPAAEEHSVAEEPVAAEDHAAAEEQLAAEDHAVAEEQLAAEDHAAADDHTAEPMLNSEINASGAQPTQTSTFSPESK